MRPFYLLSSVTILFIISFILFGPSGAFHHNYRFGWILPYMIISNEDPVEMYRFSIGEYGIIFGALEFVINFFIWFGCLALIYKNYKKKAATSQ